MFSLRSLVELAKSLLKISTGILVAYMILWDVRDELIKLSMQPLEATLSFAAAEASKLGLLIGLLLLILAILDYLYQRYEYEKICECPNRILKTNTNNQMVIPSLEGRFVSVSAAWQCGA